MRKPASDTVRTRLVQMEVLPSRPVTNTAVILNHVRQAQADGVDVVIFPEMAVPGYLIGDEWEHQSFLRECEQCTRDIQAASAGVTVIFGNVAIDWQRRNEDGRVRKYNALFVCRDGQCVGPARSPYDFVIKTLQPNYREFDDSRHFFDLRRLAVELAVPVCDLIGLVEVNGLKLACSLCEDAWDTDYGVSPMRLLAETKADLFVNINASPFTMNKNRKRTRLFEELARAVRRPIAYVNAVGIQNNGKTVFTFDGASCLYDGHSHAVTVGMPFEDTVLTHDVPMRPGAEFGEKLIAPDDGTAQLYEAIRYGTTKFMDLCGVDKVTVGISGGIDSSVVAALYSRILPPERLLLVNMPGSYTSTTTRRLAERLATGLGCYYAEIPIMDSVALTRRQTDGLTIRTLDGRLTRSLTLDPLMNENVQARDRSSRVLAAVSAAFGGVFTCNANKSEATVGYATLYGDVCGYFANIADLWKGEVYALARHLNEQVFEREIVPRGSIDLTPSAELSPQQNVDEGKGDPLIYPYHDRLFRTWVERWDRATPEDILEWHRTGQLETNLEYDGKIADLFESAEAFVADLEKWWNAYQGMGVAKRIQAPPVLALKRRAFGFDHRESQMGAMYTRRYHTLKADILARPT